MRGVISKSENYKPTKMDSGSFVFGVFVPILGFIIIGSVILFSVVTA